MTSAQANATMQAHFHECNVLEHPHGTGRLCCARGRELYSNYLTARAVELGLSPESFPGVRAWMREQGTEPMPMSDAIGMNRLTCRAEGCDWLAGNLSVEVGLCLYYCIRHCPHGGKHPR